MSVSHIPKLLTLCAQKVASCPALMNVRGEVPIDIQEIFEKFRKKYLNSKPLIRFFGENLDSLETFINTVIKEAERKNTAFAIHLIRSNPNLSNQNVLTCILEKVLYFPNRNHDFENFLVESGADAKQAIIAANVFILKKDGISQESIEKDIRISAEGIDGVIVEDILDFIFRPFFA